MKTVSRYTRAGKNGKLITCPHCMISKPVYHFSWSALSCQSCGTGAIASSIAASFKKCKSPLKINFTGGSMKVTFTKNINIFKNIYLEGSQNFVYSGKIKI